MTIESVNCPQCGAALNAVSASGFYTCPYCKSRVRVTFYEPDPGLREDGRTTVHDPETHAELCYIKLPRGWQASGQVIPDRQSLSWPFSLHVQAVSPQQDAMIYYRSGSSFKEILASSVMRHQEGGYDQGDLMPMLRRRTAAQYADGYLLGQLPKGLPVHLVAERPLARLPAEDFTLKQNELRQNTASQLQRHTPPGMFSAVDQVFYEGTTRIYAYEENGQAIRQAVTTVVNGVQISFGSPMVILGGKTTFLQWDVPFVVTLKTTADRLSAYYDSLVMFCSTMQASSMLLQKMDQVRNQILLQLGRQQQDNFEAHQRLMREQQASFDAYNQAWMANSQHRHQVARQAAASQRSSEDRISDMRSEAIRGVNTYIRPDGTEVEYSVVYESAYAHVNDSQTTFATESRSFESPDWIRMERKY